METAEAASAVVTNKRFSAERRKRARRIGLATRIVAAVMALGLVGSGIAIRSLKDEVSEIPALREQVQSLQKQANTLQFANIKLMPIGRAIEASRSVMAIEMLDAFQSRSYATATYLGKGYFLTVKHGVKTLGKPDEPTNAVWLKADGSSANLDVIDAGTATSAVDPGDWAILHSDDKFSVPGLVPNLSYDFAFGDPIAKIGNSFNKGINFVPSYVGTRSSAGGSHVFYAALGPAQPGVSG
jgi:hypothetical protein